MARPDGSVRIGGACAGVGDGGIGAPRLLAAGDCDYLVFDYLSEYFMPAMGRARAADPAGGFPREFVDGLFAQLLPDALAKGVKLVLNVGAVNPGGCAAAMKAVAARLGLTARIAHVEGDDLLARADALVAAGTRGMADASRRLDAKPFTGVNAYIGAFPIARALAMGADVIVTGRIVDSALVLGPLIHEFGWEADDHDLLAAGTAIGHLLECGAQATGGLFTDWREVGSYADIGYPIAECRADGSAIITKAEGTGGLVSVGTVAEQLLYEIGDPRAYHMPDVVADLSGVRLEQVGPDRVRVTGARGTPPSGQLKAIATWDDGWSFAFGFPMRGPDAAAKARAVVGSLLERMTGIFRGRNMGDYRRTKIEIIGDEASYGAQARRHGSREIFCRVAMEHDDPRAALMTLHEQGTASISMAPGHPGAMLMSQPGPIGRAFAFLIDRDEVPVTVELDGRQEAVPFAAAAAAPAASSPPSPPAPGEPTGSSVPLSHLAWVRSGDKGNMSNVGVIAREADYLPYLATALSEEAVARFYAHLFEDGRGVVRRYYLPGIHALNFTLDDALEGGCLVSLRFDPFGKSIAQEILDFPVPVPAALAANLG